MDVFLRTIAIIIEVSILGVIAFSILGGAKLTIFGLGINSKYRKAVTMALITVGFIVIVFFIAHLTSFYPTI